MRQNATLAKRGAVSPSLLRSGTLLADNTVAAARSDRASDGADFRLAMESSHDRVL